MLLEIRLSNFYSIKEEIVLDLRAGHNKTQKAETLRDNTFDYNDEQILKSIAIYGANASGKSNVMSAVSSCCSIISKSHLNNENDIFDFVPFKFENYPQKPSNFFVRFVLNGIEYEYSFSLTRTEIINEELFYYPNGRRAKIFTRNEAAGKTKKEIYSFSTAIPKPMDIAEYTSRKTLYISRASQMDREIPKAIFNFFDTIIAFDIGSLLHKTKLLEKLYLENRNVLIKALEIADSDIVNISYRKEKFASEKNLTGELIFSTFHKADREIPFSLEEESSGTQTLFIAMLFIIDIVKNNKILLVDEIEMSLHTKIVEYIIGLFHSKESRAQLIYTTHNTNLLNLNKLRKDQIYFTNKRDDGSTDLYSLFDYKDFRDNMDLEKAYLQGRFDAIPYVNDSAEKKREVFY